MSKSYKRVELAVSKEMAQLRKKGMKVRAIAKLFKRSHSTVVWHTNSSYKINRQKKMHR